MKHIKIKYLIFALATFQCASIFSSASLSTLMQQSTASLQAAQALFSSSFKPGTPPAPTPVATPMSTKFTNNSSQPLLIQALVNDVKNGDPVTIPYPGSGVVTVPATTGKVTYSITMPSSNPPYAASTATYNPTAYPNGYTIGAHPTLGLVGEGITTPNPYKTYSTIFYNTVDHWTWINPIVNDLKGAGVHIPPMGAMAVNITAFPSDKVMYSIFMDEIHGLNNNQVQLPPSNPSDSKNPIGYQVYVDKHDIKWNILTETPNLTAATSYNSRSLGRMSSKKATKKNKRSWAHKTL